MIDVDFSWFAAIYIMAGMALTLGLWTYYDMRSSLHWRLERRRKTFHCVKCDTLYSGRVSETSRDCPSCGFTNGPLQF